MKGTLSKLFLIAVGAAIGSAVTYKCLRAKYDDILEDELSTMREYYKEKYQNGSVDEVEESDDEEATLIDCHDDNNISAEIKKYAEIAHTMNYANKLDVIKELGEEVDKPYVIDADDYGEYEDYSLNNLTYFADKILADDSGEIIDNVGDTVGANLWDLFPDDDDTVFIRNDRLMSDYEIQKDYRSYDEVFYISPHDSEA